MPGNLKDILRCVVQGKDYDQLVYLVQKPRPYEYRKSITSWELFKSFVADVIAKGKYRDQFRMMCAHQKYRKPASDDVDGF